MMCLKLLHQKLMSNQKMYRLEMDIPCKEVFSLDTEGFVDLADEEVRNDQHSTLQSSMCQALARFLGVSKELQQFDCVRCLCKRKRKHALPVELKKHQTFIHYFWKQIAMHKRSLDCRLAQLAASSVEYNQCAKEIRHSLSATVMQGAVLNCYTVLDYVAEFEIPMCCYIHSAHASSVILDSFAYHLTYM